MTSGTGTRALPRRRPARGRQDRHDERLRGRLVLRLHPRPRDLRLGRLPQGPHARCENIEGVRASSPARRCPPQIWHDYMTRRARERAADAVPRAAAPGRAARLHAGQLERPGSSRRTVTRRRRPRRTTTARRRRHDDHGRRTDADRADGATTGTTDDRELSVAAGPAPAGRRGLRAPARRLPAPALRARRRRAGAVGRVLAERVGAALDLPPFASSAMDGYAVRAAERRGRCRSPSGAAAGEDPPALPAGRAAGITTGGVVPDGADCVVPVERVDGAGRARPLRGPCRAGRPRARDRQRPPPRRRGAARRASRSCRSRSPR